MNQTIGVSMVVASTILYAILPPLLKKTGSQLSPFTVMAISMGSLFFLSLLGSLIVDKAQTLRWSDLRGSVLILMLVGAINFGAFWLGILSFKYMPLWQQSLFGLLSPILIGVFAFFILGEQLSSKLFLSLAIMGVGLAVGLAK
ncbi:MAG TPA: hypothetical protein DEP87_02050 [Candidatus Pacebacteria bacterium]|nr:hypothetical protein [Candidatus Paceibacterota bacterium]